MIFKLKKEVMSDQLVDWLGLTMNGPSVPISNIAPIDSAVKGSLSFISKSRPLDDMPDGLCLISEVKGPSSTIISHSPRLDFIRALAELDKNVGFDEATNSPVIHSSVKIGNNVTIENNVSIDEGSVIEHGVVIKSNTRIGKNCLIRSNACIGGDGFGFEKYNGVPLKFIHLGGVEIGDNVEIGACACVARGALGNTKIHSNVKVDNLVHIAHNCTVAEGSLITACAELSGGVAVGKNVWIGPNVSVIQKIHIGDDAFIGIGAVVIRDVEAGTTVVGNPARVLTKQR